MAQDKIYLSVAKETHVSGKGYLAVISKGSPQLGDKDVFVLDTKIVKNMKMAKIWYREQIEIKPWEARN